MSTFDERSMPCNRIIYVELFAAIIHMQGCPFCKNASIVLVFLYTITSKIIKKERTDIIINYLVYIMRILNLFLCLKVL